MPASLRRRAVRLVAPSHTVGAICVIQRPSDGAVALVQQSYRQNWGLPGGLLKRREAAADAAKRETREEIGLDVDLVGEASVVVAHDVQRVDVIYLAAPAGGASPADDELVSHSAEIVGVGWFQLDELPALQHETAEALNVLWRAGRLDRPIQAGSR